MRGIQPTLLLSGTLLLLPLHLSAQQSAPALGEIGTTAGSAAAVDTFEGTDTSAGLLPGDPDVVPSNPDFLFRRPVVTFSVRGGMFMNRGSSEIHDLAVRDLTLERSDFRGGSGGLELGFWTGDRLEIVLGGDWSEVSLASESRNWVEEDGRPIQQMTRLRNGPSLTAGIKGYLAPRGDAISRFAWTPRKMNAFVGAGFGWTGYEFEQWGDFVDEQQELIFAADIASSGGAFTTYATGGLEYSLTNRISAIGEARYSWARSALGSQFDFMELDLSGLRLMAGLGFRI
jgi:hypothetical protein